MKIFETQLPGVGRRYQVSFSEGKALTILIHNDGQRDVFWRENSDADSEELFTTTEREAQKLAEIFDGTFFEPVDDELDDALSDARIKWVSIPSGSPVIGKTISDVGVRTRTGVSILAVERGEQTLPNPTPGTELRAEDVLVVVGSGEAHKAFEELLAPDTSHG
ncbi:cation:proton antiporter regulatory subunit [Halomicroarcula sp. GCM10025817]|uniref:cation:proton antiporter regulatory subunit n=1 Tax=Haloarcula TaxID=2237 RepID=UPI0023E88998|nr:TrkA C-terminal domain-containing protein [Halomicroarcula sp. SYNS111]